jgi:NYN domain
MPELYPFVHEGARANVFVDGENLAMRYGEMLGGVPAPPIMKDWYRPDVAVWVEGLSPPSSNISTRVIRKYYFTSEQGADDKRTQTEEWLKSRGFEIPHVYRRDRDRGSKQVDISLSVEMLMHAMRHHYEVAVLVAGDADYIPLVRAVQAEGKRVHLWFVSNGLAPQLRRAADYFVDLDPYFGFKRFDGA